MFDFLFVNQSPDDKVDVQGLLTTIPPLTCLMKLLCAALLKFPDFDESSHTVVKQVSFPRDLRLVTRLATRLPEKRGESCLSLGKESQKKTGEDDAPK